MIPEGMEWRYEPKWDGFLCHLSRGGGTVSMHSKQAGTKALLSGSDRRGTLPCARSASWWMVRSLSPMKRDFSFDALLQRIHPAAEMQTSSISRLRLQTAAIKFFGRALLLFCDQHPHLGLPLFNCCLTMQIAGGGATPAVERAITALRHLNRKMLTTVIER